MWVVLESVALWLDYWLDYSVEPLQPVAAAAIVIVAAASAAFAVASPWTVAVAVVVPRLVGNLASPWH